jgi:hypothetical protein
MKPKTREYEIYIRRSWIVPSLCIGEVWSKDGKRLVHETQLYSEEKYAREAARLWATRSTSRAARSLES